MFNQIKKWFNDPINKFDLFGVHIRETYQFFRNWKINKKEMNE